MRQPQRVYCSWRLYNRRVQTPFNSRFISQVIIIGYFSPRFISQVSIISYFSTRSIGQVLGTIEAPDLKAAEREAASHFVKHPISTWPQSPGSQGSRAR